MFDSLRPHGLYSPWNSLGQNIGVGILPNPGLLHCRRILYQLSHKGSPEILECVTYPFSSGSSRPRNWTGVSCIAGGFFINWAIREALISPKPLLYPVSWILSSFNIRKTENSFSVKTFLPLPFPQHLLLISPISLAAPSQFPLLSLLSSFATFPSFILSGHPGLPCCSWNMPMHFCFYPGYSCLRQFHD